MDFGIFFTMVTNLVGAAMSSPVRGLANHNLS